MLTGLQDTLLLTQQKRFSSEIMLWLGVIVALGFLLGIVAVVIRKRVMGTGDEAPPLGFTLKDLREMHAQGQISDQELARAEEKALSRSRAHYLGDGSDAEEDGGGQVNGSAPPAGEAEAGDAGTENESGSSDKNRGGEPGA